MQVWEVEEERRDRDWDRQAMVYNNTQRHTTWIAGDPGLAGTLYSDDDQQWMRISMITNFRRLMIPRQWI